MRIIIALPCVRMEEMGGKLLRVHLNRRKSHLRFNCRHRRSARGLMTPLEMGTLSNTHVAMMIV